MTPTQHGLQNASGFREVVTLDNGTRVPLDVYLTDAQYRAVEKAKARGGRTQKEIEAQLLARYRELQAEAERRREADEAERLRLKCADCRWAVDVNSKRWTGRAARMINTHCGNALIRGFGNPLPNVDRLGMLRGGYSSWPHVKLCGPEKALWEPIPSRWQRLLDWLSEKIGRT